MFVDLDTIVKILLAFVCSVLIFRDILTSLWFFLN